MSGLLDTPLFYFQFESKVPCIVLVGVLYSNLLLMNYLLRTRFVRPHDMHREYLSLLALLLLLILLNILRSLQTGGVRAWMEIPAPFNMLFSV